ncbi:MAG: hypothetical protein UV64_C0001G0044 [Parcubacteria group bacterium GW2011_GWC1_43_11b]|nr:MAG: hypothetical protein UV64_C0001G0044 [Parcubacteria group bacterium GW2011_GWC1_43_11b]
MPRLIFISRGIKDVFDLGRGGEFQSFNNFNL